MTGARPCVKHREPDLCVTFESSLCMQAFRGFNRETFSGPRDWRGRTTWRASKVVGGDPVTARIHKTDITAEHSQTYSVYTHIHTQTHERLQSPAIRINPR